MFFNIHILYMLHKASRIIWGVALFVLEISLLRHFSQVMYWGLLVLLAHTTTLDIKDYKQAV